MAYSDISMFVWTDKHISTHFMFFYSTGHDETSAIKTWKQNTVS